MLNSISSIEPLKYWFLCALLALLTLALTTYSPWVGHVYYADQGWHLSIGQWMNEGLVPYKDIFEMKGLFYYFVQYLGIKIAGPQGVWLIETLLLTLGYVYLYKFSKLYLSHYWSLLSVFFCMLLYFPLNYTGDTTESIAFSFVVISAYYMQKSLKEKQELSDRQVWIIALCFVLLLHIKLNYCSYICILGLFIVIRLIVDARYKLLLRYSVLFLCATVIFNLPFMGYLYTHQALKDFFDVYFVYGFEYSGMIPTAVKADNFFDVMWMWLRDKQIFVVLIVTFVAYRYWARKADILYLLSSFVFAAIFTVGVSGYPFEHYRIIIVWQSAFFIAVFCNLLFRVRYVGPYLLFAYVLYFSISAFAWCRTYYRHEIRNEPDYLSEPRKLAEKINAVLAPGTNVLMVDCPPSTYFWCGKPLAIKYGAFQDMIFKARPAAEDDFYSQINSGACDAIVCSKEYYSLLKEKMDISIYPHSTSEGDYVILSK